MDTASTHFKPFAHRFETQSYSVRNTFICHADDDSDWFSLEKSAPRAGSAPPTFHQFGGMAKPQKTIQSACDPVMKPQSKPHGKRNGPLHKVSGAVNKAPSKDWTMSDMSTTDPGSDGGGYLSQGFTSDNGNEVPVKAGAVVVAPRNVLTSTHMVVPMTGAEAKQDKQDASSNKDNGGMMPSMGFFHKWRPESMSMGTLSADLRTFKKTGSDGQLSTIEESKIRSNGRHRYVVRFTGNTLSDADCVGFVFAKRQSTPKNAPRIQSIFFNSSGVACIEMTNRMHTSIAKPFKLGDWVELDINLASQKVILTVWPQSGQAPSRPARAELSYGRLLTPLTQKFDDAVINNTCTSGHFSAIVKHAGVSVNIGS